MAAIRASKRRRRPPECSQCPLPAALHPKTGRPMSLCKLHLDLDNDRAMKSYQAKKVANG
jgi:hypothetical protein